MTRNSKYRLLSAIFLACALFTNLRADNEAVLFTARAPKSVILGQPFQLVYSTNTNDSKDLRLPELTGFNILAGPFTSRSSSIQIINGKQSSSVSVSYTYTLQAQKEGSFSIGPASINVKGEKYNSNGLSIKVLPPDANPAPTQQRSQNRYSEDSNISNETIFIRTIVSKSNMYEQEAFLVTYKLYTLLDVIQCPMKKVPEFNGFIRNDIELPESREFDYENYNGRNYKSVTLYEVLLFPQRAGSLRIERVDFEAVIRIANRRAMRSIFEDPYTNISHNLSAPAVSISAKSLPENKPASFSGAVGRFSINSSLSNKEVKANEAITLKVNINGNGNFRMVKNPEFKFPESFETYDPKVNNNFKVSASGLSGSKSVEYLIIPRQSGNFEIPAAEFSYFDVSEKRYKTLHTPAYSLSVLKAEGSETPIVPGSENRFVNKEDFKQLGSDIRFIHTEPILLEAPEKSLFGSLNAWLMYVIPLLLALLAFMLFRKHAKESADIKLMRNKKAQKIAQKRLKAAQKLLNEGKKDMFYDEVLKSTWTYLSDKLSILPAELTKERVTAELEDRKIEAALADSFMQILNTCEFARYAPNTGQKEMGNLYSEAIDAITTLEQAIKKG